MTQADLDARLAAAGRRLDDLRPDLEAGGPWPLAERFDHAPEAEWGPREILAHLGEMLPFWLGEAERLIEADAGSRGVGRLATDDLRVGMLARDRTLPIRELVARIENGIARWRRRWPEMTPDERARSGLHVTLGELTVTDIATRFAVNHLEEHLVQLEDAMADAGQPGAGPG